MKFMATRHQDMNSLIFGNLGTAIFKEHLSVPASDSSIKFDKELLKDSRKTVCK